MFDFDAFRILDCGSSVVESAVDSIPVPRGLAGLVLRPKPFDGKDGRLGTVVEQGKRVSNRPKLMEVISGVCTTPSAIVNNVHHSFALLGAAL